MVDHHVVGLGLAQIPRDAQLGFVVHVLVRKAQEGILVDGLANGLDGARRQRFGEVHPSGYFSFA